jgi:hypothetical protein
MTLAYQFQQRLLRQQTQPLQLQLVQEAYPALQVEALQHSMRPTQRMYRRHSLQLL